MRDTKSNSVNVRVEPTLLKEVDALCDTMKIDRSDAVREALKNWVVEEMFKQRIRGVFFEKK